MFFCQINDTLYVRLKRESAGMKKLVWVLLGALLLLGACSSESEEVETSNQSAEPKNEEVNNNNDDNNDNEGFENAEANDEENNDEESEEVLTDDEETLIDEEKYSIDLVKVVEEEMMGDKEIKAVFEVENKSDDYLEIFAETASADGKMINAENMNVFIEVSPGKEAEDSFQIFEFEDEDFELPELNDELEIDIMVNDEDWEFEDKQTITIDF